MVILHERINVLCSHVVRLTHGLNVESNIWWPGLVILSANLWKFCVAGGPKQMGQSSMDGKKMEDFGRTWEGNGESSPHEIQGLEKGWRLEFMAALSLYRPCRVSFSHDEGKILRWTLALDCSLHSRNGEPATFVFTRNLW